mmetsp:Transcript_28284/g.65795  ORF Transcript_28284/g.65795 Transcript_28284/m.65795 type:complete len:430 (-) Transcript_28284:61-1350(-)
MGVQSNAALASLTVSKAVYEKDLLLQWICQIASPLQLNVTVDAKSPLSLEAQGAKLSSRNAILRGICAMGLHNALDQAPYYLLGGSGNGAALKMGQLVQWMSAADSLRGKFDDAIAQKLESQLSTQSFLVGSSQPSLADYDIALAMDATKLNADDYPALVRWHAACVATLTQLAPQSFSIPLTAPPAASGPLTFYYGTEDVSAILKPPAPKKAKEVAAPANAKGGDNPNNKGKQPQQQKHQQQQQGKKGKKGGGKPQPAAAPAVLDISALDIRVGKIVKAWHHESADKLFCEEIDLGTETRQIASGLRPFYQTEDLTGRMVLVLCNLKKRNLVGFPSHGMVLCASNDDHTKVEFVVPAEGSQPGDKVQFGDHQGDPEPENKVGKKKIFEALAPDLKTDDQGQVIWKDSVATTGAGVVTALNKMAGAHVS